MIEHLRPPDTIAEHDLPGANAPIRRHIGAAAEALADYERGDETEPINEPLVYGSERLRSLVDGLSGGAGPEPGTFMAIPEHLKRTIVAHTVNPPDLAEGAPPERWSVELPTRLFVHAPDFVDWRHGRADKKDGKSSARVIRQYARKPRETAPPIQHVMVYMQPNGYAFSSLEGDGAHRLAAAMRRGDETVRARNVVFAQLEEDYLQPSVR